MFRSIVRSVGCTHGSDVLINGTRRSGINLGKTQCPSTTDERDRMSKIPYASAIGSIMYAMICTRPDVSYALSEIGRAHV